MKKLLLLLILGAVITLSGCSKDPEFELICTISGGGQTNEIIYTYTDEELLSIVIGGESYDELATEQVLFESRGRDEYITMQIQENSGEFDMSGVTFSGYCLELAKD